MRREMYYSLCFYSCGCCECFYVLSPPPPPPPPLLLSFMDFERRLLEAANIQGFSRVRL